MPLLPTLVPTNDPRLAGNPNVMTASGGKRNALQTWGLLSKVHREDGRAIAEAALQRQPGDSMGTLLARAMAIAQARSPEGLLARAPATTNASRGKAYGAATAAAARVRSGRGY